MQQRNNEQPVDREAPSNVGGIESGKAIPPAAQRALAEAEQRRRQAAETAFEVPKEINGRKGPEPVRYGDWENKGIASDF